MQVDFNRRVDIIGQEINRKSIIYTSLFIRNAAISIFTADIIKA